jgi:hypothetical protein
MIGPHEQATVAATDLAERIVDEISESAQDWSAIERHARQLVEVLSGLDARAAGGSPRPRRGSWR